MKISRRALATGTLWTIATYCTVQVARFITNIVLARLLAPELFGIMVIINTFKTGAELVTDVAIGQNIIRSRHGDEPTFYNTAWTLQLLRGLLLWAFGCAAALPLAYIYDVPILAVAQPVAAFVFIFSGFASVSSFLIQKRMEIAALAKYEIASVLLWALAQIMLAYFFPTIWSLVLGVVIGAVIGMGCSYVVLPAPQHSLTFNREYALEIILFAKWIFLSSIIFFLAMCFDRLYLAGVVPLATLGVYGIARSISDLLAMLFLRFSNLIVFPLIASSSSHQRDELRKKIALTRLLFLLGAAAAFSCFAAFSDLAINLIFDKRYHEAGVMLPILVVGSWFFTICSLNEQTLLGLGKPVYGAVANGVKLSWLLLAIPIGFTRLGILGVVAAVAASELFRYPAIVFGQSRERFSFAGQDLVTTGALFALLTFWEWVRWKLGIGSALMSTLVS